MCARTQRCAILSSAHVVNTAPWARLSQRSARRGVTARLARPRACHVRRGASVCLGRAAQRQPRVGLTCRARARRRPRRVLRVASVPVGLQARSRVLRDLTAPRKACAARSSALAGHTALSGLRRRRIAQPATIARRTPRSRLHATWDRTAQQTGCARLCHATAPCFAQTPGCRRGNRVQWGQCARTAEISLAQKESFAPGTDHARLG